jgi:phosphate transport system substrate-binding protein
MLHRTSILAIATLALASCSAEDATPIRVTGSSTVYPFTKLVADAFVKENAKRQPPLIESVGTGSGIDAFCKVTGPDSPDILDASRRLTRAEFDKCKSNGIGDILEIPFGLDGIALAESTAGPKLELTSQDLYLGLAANPRGKPNTAKTWADVNPKLPAIPILVLGPPKSSGTHDMFQSQIMRAGCLAAMPQAAGLERGSDPTQFQGVCLDLRLDGPYVEEGENDNRIVAALEANPKALGLFGYSYLEQNAAKLRAVPIDGVSPDPKTIADGKYPGFRTLFLYVKKVRVTAKPTIKELLKLYTRMAEPGGPLVAKGLIPMSERSRKSSAETVENEFPLEAQDLP